MWHGGDTVQLRGVVNKEVIRSKCPAPQWIAFTHNYSVACQVEHDLQLCAKSSPPTKACWCQASATAYVFHYRFLVDELFHSRMTRYDFEIRCSGDETGPNRTEMRFSSAPGCKDIQVKPRFDPCLVYKCGPGTCFINRQAKKEGHCMCPPKYKPPSCKPCHAMCDCSAHCSNLAGCWSCLILVVLLVTVILVLVTMAECCKLSRKPVTVSKKDERLFSQTVPPYRASCITLRSATSTHVSSCAPSKASTTTARTEQRNIPVDSKMDETHSAHVDDGPHSVQTDAIVPFQVAEPSPSQPAAPPTAENNENNAA